MPRNYILPPRGKVKNRSLAAHFINQSIKIYIAPLQDPYSELQKRTRAQAPFLREARSRLLDQLLKRNVSALSQSGQTGPPNRHGQKPCSVRRPAAQEEGGQQIDLGVTLVCQSDPTWYKIDPKSTSSRRLVPKTT